ncbi:MAG: hypothetical protein Q4B03_00515 [Lachnospiraceae bacterium]|nr:hypothetical protein [Lachnospiraceae bacterium]
MTLVNILAAATSIKAIAAIAGFGLVYFAAVSTGILKRSNENE